MLRWHNVFFHLVFVLDQSSLIRVTTIFDIQYIGKKIINLIIYKIFFFFSIWLNIFFFFCSDVIVVTTLDTITSFMVGCTIFGILGNLAKQMGTDDISTVVRGGSGLAFISYPDALSRFNIVPQVFAILFFLMLYVLCTGSVLGFCASIDLLVREFLPVDKKIASWRIILAITSSGFLISLVYITPVCCYILKIKF